MNSAAPLCLHTQGRGCLDGREGVEEGVEPWRLLSLGTHIQSLYYLKHITTTWATDHEIQQLARYSYRPKLISYSYKIP